MAAEELFSREEVLGGLPGRRAGALLFHIEAATARAVEYDRRSAAVTDISGSGPPTDAAADGDGSEEWLGTFRQDGSVLPRASIQQMERYASQWRYLAPKAPRLRAAVARLLGQRHRFTRASVPGIREALGLDTEPVREAYQSLYGEPLEGLYTTQLGLFERLGWALVAFGKRLATASPFWIAFAFSLMGNFTEAVLVLPLAMATVGPQVALLLLAIIGGANVVTMACMAEAVTRSGAIEYRNLFLGRMAANTLGRLGARLAYWNSIAQWFMVVLAGQVGLALLLQKEVGLLPQLSVLLWTGILCYRLWRIEHRFSMTGDLVLGAACVVSILALSVMALAHGPVAHPAAEHTPAPPISAPLEIASSAAGASSTHPADEHGAESHDGGSDHSDEHASVPTDASGHGPAVPAALSFAVLGGAFGGLLMIFYGQNSVPAIAKLVLPRDPGGRSLIRGCAAGTLCAVGAQALWLLGVNAATPREILLGHHAHTAVEPLAPMLGFLGPLVVILVVCLFIGLDGTGATDMLFNLVRERIPAEKHRVLLLSSESGRVLFHRRDSLGERPRVGVVYLGTSGGHPHFRVDVQSGFGVRRTEITVKHRWELSSLFNQHPELRRHGYHLTLEPVEASEQVARILIATSLQVEQEGGRDALGPSLSESLALSTRELRLLRMVLAEGAGTAADAVTAGLAREPEATAILQSLARKGMLRESVAADGALRYEPHWGKRRRSRLPEAIWKSLEEPHQEESAPRSTAQLRAALTALADRARAIITSETGRFLLGVSPILATALLSHALIRTGRASFTAILAVGGVLVLTLASGIFPVLLLISCRRKGVAQPDSRWSQFTRPWVLGLLYLGFLSLLLLHSVIPWHGEPGRIAALSVAAVILGSTAVMARRGAFSSRLVVEVRDDLREGRAPAFRVTAAGQPLALSVRLHSKAGEQHLVANAGQLPRFEDLGRMEVHLPSGHARELRVWVHRVTPEGDSVPVHGRAEVIAGGETREFDLGLTGGEILVPLDDGPYTVVVSPTPI